MFRRRFDLLTCPPALFVGWRLASTSAVLFVLLVLCLLLFGRSNLVNVVTM